jgi:hypothetical protein
MYYLWIKVKYFPICNIPILRILALMAIFTVVSMILPLSVTAVGATAYVHSQNYGTGYQYGKLHGTHWTPQQRVSGEVQLSTTKGPSLASNLNGTGYQYGKLHGTHWTPQQRVSGAVQLSTSNSPSLAVFNGKLYMAWKGSGSDEHMYYNYFDGTNWSPEQQVSGATVVPATSARPSLAVFNGKLYMAWEGSGSDYHIYYNYFNGTHWTSQTRVEGGPPSAYDSPSLAVFNGKLYLAWEGTDGHIYYNYFDGAKWSPQQRVSDGVQPATNKSPSLAVFNGKLYMAWEGSGSDYHIYYNYFDGTKWTSQQRVSDGVQPSAYFSPSLAVFNGKLYMAWEGSGSDHNIYYNYFDGAKWSPQQAVSGAVTNRSPSLAVFNGKLYMAWIYGSDIYYNYFDGAKWSPQTKVTEAVQPSSKYSPSLAVFNGKLYMAWRGVISNEDDQHIYYNYFDGAKWSPQQRVSDGVQPATSARPSLAVFNGKLYMAWKGSASATGTTDDQHIYYNYFDGAKWSPQQRVSDGVQPATSSGPSLAVFNNKLYMAWEGSSDSHIYYNYFDGAKWSPQQRVSDGVQPATSDRPSLAVFNDKLYMAWWGLNSASHVDWSMYYNYFDGAKWSPQQAVSRASAREGEYNTAHGPSLAFFNGKLYMAWVGSIANSDHIYYSYFDGTNWSPEQRVLGAVEPETYDNPSLVVFNDKLYMAWRGPFSSHPDIKDDHIYYNYFDGAKWSPQQIVNWTPQQSVLGVMHHRTTGQGTNMTNLTVPTRHATRHLSKVY